MGDDIIKSKEAIYLQEKLDKHIEFCEERFKQGEEHFKKIQEYCMRNAGADEEMKEAVQKLADSMSPVIELHRDLIGATHIGISVQKFGTWLASLAVVGGVLYAVYTWLIRAIDKI